jgi:hypothetical protein
MVRWRLMTRLQALVLFGVGVAAGSAAQGFALTLEGLFQIEAGPLGQEHHLGAGHFQQAAVGGVGDGLLLDRAVDDDAFEFPGLDGLQGDGGLDGLGEHLFDTGEFQGAAKAGEVARIARQRTLKVSLAAEELPIDVLRPAGTDRLVAFVVGVFEVEKTDHEPDRQTFASGGADAGAGQRPGGAEEVGAFGSLAGARLVFEGRCQCGFDVLPGHPGGQDREGVAHIQHGVQAAAEKVRCAHTTYPRNLPETDAITIDSGSL